MLRVKDLGMMKCNYLEADCLEKGINSLNSMKSLCCTPLTPTP